MIVMGTIGVDGACPCDAGRYAYPAHTQIGFIQLPLVCIELGAIGTYSRYAAMGAVHTCLVLGLY